MLVSLVMSAMSTTASAIAALLPAIAAISVAILPLLLAVRALLPRSVLLSIPYSHYVEIARWSIERPANGSPPPGVFRAQGARWAARAHRWPLSPALWRNSQRVVVSWLLFWRFLCLLRLAKACRLRTNIATCFRGAMLHHGRGECLQDSWSILEHCGYAVRPETRLEFDEVLGPSVRQIGYHYIFRMPGVYRAIQSCGPAMMALFDAMETFFRTSTTIMPSAKLALDPSRLLPAQALP